jgi:hypothetical protein
MSDVFHTTDLGAHWDVINFRELTGKFNTRINFTSDSNILYTLRTNANGQYSPVKSTDKGKTWKLTGSPGTGWAGNYGTFQLYAHPKRTDRVIVSSYNTLYYSSNGGTSFKSIYFDNIAKGLHLAGVYYAGDSIIVAVNKGLIISTNGGASWSGSSVLPITGIGAGEEIVSFAGAQSGSSIMFVAVTLTAANVRPQTYGSDVGNFKGIYKLDFGSSLSWTNITSSLPSATDKAYYVGFAEGNTSQFYLGGQATIGGSKFGTVFRTTNGGTSFQNIFLDAGYQQNKNNTTGSDIVTGWIGTGLSSNYGNTWIGINTTEGLAVDPNDVNRIIRTDKSAVYTSTDGGTHWKQAYVAPSDAHQSGLIPTSSTYGSSGLETTVASSIAWSSPHDMFVGCLDISAIRSSDSGKKFSFDWSGLRNQQQRINDVSFVLRHPNGKLYACEGEVPGSNGDYTDTRVGLSGGRLMVSSDTGKTWSVVKDFSAPTLWMTLDPDNSNHAYVAVSDTGNGNGGIWECDDLITNSSWKKLPAPPRTQGRAIQVHILPEYKWLIAVYGARDSGNYHFTKSSGVFSFIDSSQTWIDFTPKGAEYDVRDYAYSPQGEHRFISVGILGGIGATGLYHTGPGIVGWGNEMQNVSVRCVTVVEGAFDDYEAYISTENDGLYYAHDFQIDTVKSYPFRSPGRVFLNPYNNSEVWVTSNGYGLAVGKYVPTDSTPSVPVLISPKANDTLKTGPTIFSWHPSKNATFYRLIIYKDSAGTNIYFGQNAQDTAYTMSSFPSSTSLWWSVKAVNGSLTVPSDEIRKFTTAVITKTTLISPPYDTTSIDTNVTLLWHSAPQANKYLIQLSLNYSFDQIIASDIVSDTTVVFNGLSLYTQYYWRVKPLAADSSGIWTEPWRFSTKPGQVGTVTLFTPVDSTLFYLVDSNSTYRNLMYSYAQYASAYQLHISYSPSFDSIIIDDSVGRGQHLVKLFFENATYYWRMRAGNALGWGEWSETRQFYHSIFNSVTREDENDIVVFPNPAIHSVTVRGSSLVSGAKLELMNILGEVVKREEVLSGSTEAVFLLDGTPRGTYYLLIKTTDKKQRMIKVIK